MSAMERWIFSLSITSQFQDEWKRVKFFNQREWFIRIDMKVIFELAKCIYIYNTDTKRQFISKLFWIRLMRNTFHRLAWWWQAIIEVALRAIIFYVLSWKIFEFWFEWY